MIHEGFPLPDFTWIDGAEFWQAAQRSELRVPRCDACGTWIWYPRPSCPSCNSTSITWTEASGRARLYSWSVVHHVFLQEFADLVPYVTGLAAIDEDPAVRLATFVLADPLDLRADMPLEVAFRPLRFKNVPGEVLAPMFVPAAG